MKYYEVDFKIQPLSQDACDLLAALAGEAGFETFEDTDEGIRGYVQQALFNQEVLDQAIQFFPMTDIHIIYNVKEAEDKDWNEQWEREGFEPIVISNGRMVIHDGRHLPQIPNTHHPTPITIEIDAHMAFGTGTHETTRMICATLMEEPLKGKDVLDAGCGTGILGIAALKLGAKNVTAYDIDEWSTENTRHNAIINHVDDRLLPLCGDATLLDTMDTRFDYVLANINRNILLQDMERFRQVMKPHGTLIMSGFYAEDIPLLQAEGEEQGLTLDSQRKDGQWACIILRAQ